MLRLILVLLTLSPCLFAGKPPDHDALITKLRYHLDRAMSRGTPTDKEILELKKARQDVSSANHEEVAAAVDTIDRIAHTQSFRRQDASDIRKDISDIRGHKSFLFLRLP
jgi:hypothetical protein